MEVQFPGGGGRVLREFRFCPTVRLRVAVAGAKVRR